MKFDAEDLRQLAEHLGPIVREEIATVLRQRMGEPQQYVTMQQAADLFRVNRSVIRDSVLRRELTGLKVGRQYRFRVSDLERWAEANARGG